MLLWEFVRRLIARHPRAWYRIGPSLWLAVASLSLVYVTVSTGRWLVGRLSQGDPHPVFLIALCGAVCAAAGLFWYWAFGQWRSHRARPYTPVTDGVSAGHGTGGEGGARAGRRPLTPGSLRLTLGMGVFLCVLGLGMAIATVWSLRRNQQAAHWPTVPAIVLEASVREIHGRRGAVTYRPVVWFRYSVAGKTHQDYRVHLGTWSTSQAEAGETVARYPPGTPVRAYVDPADADTALLEPGTWPPSEVRFGLGGLFLVAMGLWMSINTARVLSSKRWKRPVSKSHSHSHKH